MSHGPASLMSTHINPRDGIELGHAMADRLGRDLGARILAIKGPIPARQGLLPPRSSADVDLLIAPSEFERVLLALCGLGWSSIDSGGEGRAFQRHSVTLMHPLWPVTIDAHERFPGFLADSGEVFEALWSERCVQTVAQQEISATGPLGSTLIVALNALRLPDHPDTLACLDALASVWDGSGWNTEQLAQMAAQTGSTQTLASLFERLGVVIADASAENDPGLREWRGRQRIGGVRGIGWLRELQSAPWRSRPGILWRAVFTDNDATLRRYGMSADGRGRLRAHSSRIGLLLKDLPSFFRAFAEARQLFEDLPRDDVRVARSVAETKLGGDIDGTSSGAARANRDRARMGRRSRR